MRYRASGGLRMVANGGPAKRLGARQPEALLAYLAY
jgi:hypothetical protein